MNDLKQLTALTALNNMFTKGWLDICTIDSVAKMLGVNPKGEAYDILRPLHCIHFNVMPEAVRDQVPELIKQCLGVQPIFQFASRELAGQFVEVPPEATPGRPGLLRLLGRGK